MSKSLILIMVILVNFCIKAEVSPDMSNTVITSSTGFVQRLFAGTETQKFINHRWELCRNTDFDNSEAFKEIDAIGRSSCASSINTFIEEAQSSGEVGAKERFCNRFVEELVDNPNNDNESGSCPGVLPSSDALEEFRSQCASKLQYINAQRSDHYKHYGQIFSENEESHKSSIAEYIKEYDELSREQNNLIGELMSSQDGEIAIEGLVCRPESREKIVNCSGTPKFQSYIGDSLENCLLKDEEACKLFHPSPNEDQETSGDINQRRMMILMAKENITRFANSQLDDLLSNNKSPDEAFSAFQKTIVDTYVQNSLEISPDSNTEDFLRNSSLIVSSLGSLSSFENLQQKLSDPESEEYKSCENPCSYAVDYFVNHLSFPEGMSAKDKTNKATEIMAKMNGLNENDDKFKSRYKGLQLIHRIKQNPSAEISEDELRDSGFLRHGTLALEVENGAENLAQAFKHIIISLNAAENDEDRLSSFEIFKKFNMMESNSSTKACESFQVKFDRLCKDIADNKRVLKPDETDQCLDFAFNETYRNDLHEMWRNNNYSTEQINSNYYEFVGLACIIAQDSFSENNPDVREHFRRRIGGESPTEILKNDMDGASHRVENIDLAREGDLTEKERLLEVMPIEDSLIPDMDKNPFGDGISIARSSNDRVLKDSSLKSGGLNNNIVGRDAAGAFAGLATGSVNGFNTGLTGINTSLGRDRVGDAGDTVTNIENNVDPSDPRYSGYLSQIDDLKASLAALESRLAGNPLPNAQGVPQSSAELLALQAEIEKERAELEKMRAELAAKLNEDGTSVVSGDQSGVDVNVATSFASPAAAEAIAPPVEEVLEGGEAPAPVTASMSAPSYGDGSGVRKSEGYESALFLTATTTEDLIAQYGAPIEMPRSALEGRIMQAVNLDLLEPGQPVYKDLGEDRYLRYTLLENGEIEIKNIVLEDAKKLEQNNQDDDEVRTDPKIRYEQFEKL